MPMNARLPKAFTAAAAGAVLVLVARSAPAAAAPAVPPAVDPGRVDVREAEEWHDVPALVWAVASTDDRQAAAAVAALGRVGGADARTAVRQFVGDVRPPVRVAAIRAHRRLADWADPRSAAPVRRVVTSGAPADVLVAALQVLGDVRSVDSVDPILDQMNHADRTVRVAAARAAGDILGLRLRFDPDDAADARLGYIQQVRTFFTGPGVREYLRRY